MRNIIYYSVALIFFASGTYLITNKTKTTEEKRRILLHPPEKYLKHFTLGYNDALADSLWLRWIQDSSECGKNLIKRELFDQRYKIKDLNLVLNKEKISYLKKDVCDKGWGYHMIDGITDLSPQFKIAYTAGVNHLSIISNDHEGARLIIEKAMSVFKKDWRIFFFASYLYLYELQQPKKARNYIYKAIQLGAPSWMNSLAARLFHKTGGLEVALIILNNYLKKVENKKERKKIIQRIYDLKKELKEQNAT